MEWPNKVYVQCQGHQFASEDFQGPGQEIAWYEVDNFPDSESLIDARELLALVMDVEE